MTLRDRLKVPKFINQVDQITFNPNISSIDAQEIIIITERCVFNVIKNGLELIEIAPGIDIKNNIVSVVGFDIAVSPNLKTMAI